MPSDSGKKRIRDTASATGSGVSTAEVHNTDGGSEGGRLEGGRGSPQRQTPLRKRIHDRVHGQITLPGLLVAVMDTCQFQRLRQLKQLGCVDLLFPSATHSRFEHSLGVAHLAGVFVYHLQTEQPELDINCKDVLCVQLAGLVHDLGHGPFSHTYEQFINELRKERDPDAPKWNHEDMSVMMLRELIRANKIDLARFGLHPTEDLKFVELLIRGLEPHLDWPEKEIGRTEEKRFLLDIVANARSGVDVDKLDYFIRDSVACFGKECIDVSASRLISGSRVIKVGGVPEVCFEEKLMLNLHDFFSLRLRLHKQVYQHHTAKVAEQMLMDALRAAEPHFRLGGGGGSEGCSISECANDPVAYARLGDWIVNAIESSSDPNLEEARTILQGLRERRLYNVVDYLLLDKHFGKRSAEEIVARLVALGGGRFAAADVVVTFAELNFGAPKGEDVSPLSKVHYFNPKQDKNKARPWQENEEQSPMGTMCDAFVETKVFVYSRHDQAWEAIKEAYNLWAAEVREHNMEKRGSRTFTGMSFLNMSSPAKKAKRSLGGRID